MAIEPTRTRPLLRFEVLENPEQPTVAILVLWTAEGPSTFLMTKQVLTAVATSLQEIATKMPDKQDQK